MTDIEIVFLRVLEYYQGILFLTTNQIAQFDIAVQSRIHIAIHYEALTEEQTSRIFLGFLEQYRGNGMIRDYDAIMKYVDRELLRKKFDGRQLRNIVSSAMGYARGRGENKMTVDDITHVVHNVEEFGKDVAGQRKTWQDIQRGARIQ